MAAVIWLGGPFLLGSNGSRQWINRSVDRSLQTEGTLAPISTKGGVIYSAEYTGKGRPKTHVASIQAKDLSARPEWLKLFSGVCDFNYIGIKNLDLVIGTPAPDPPNDHPATQLPPNKWHIQGIASGSLDLPGDLGDANSSRTVGVVHLDKAKLDWSLLFGKIGSLVKQLGLNDSQLDGVDAQVNRQGQHFEFSNLSVKYQSLLRVEGNGAIDGDQIKANLTIGLASSLLDWLPGVQQKVFTEQREGFYWTQMQVTGPLNDPKEDLSKRITDALTQGMSNQFKNQAKSLLYLLGR